MEILRTKDGKYALKTPLALRSRTFLPCNHFQNPHSCHLTTRRIFYLCSQLQYPHRFHFATQRVFLPYSQLQLPQLFPLTAPHIYLLSIQLQHPRRCRLGSLRISLLFIQAECPQMVYSRVPYISNFQKIRKTHKYVFKSYFFLAPAQLL